MKLQAKNIKVVKKEITLILGLSVVFGTGGCIFDNQPPTIDQPVADTLSQTSKDTYLDEVLDAEGDDQASLDDIAALEDALERYNVLKDVNFGEDHYNDLSDEEKANADALTTEEIELLMEELDNEDLSIVDQSRLSQQLYYLRNSAQEEIEENGITTSINVLKRGVKAAACESAGLEAEYYDYVTIDAASQNPYDLGLTVTDPISGASTHIKVDSNSIYGEMIQQIYSLQELENLSFDEIRNLTNESLNLVKVSVYSGATLSGDTMTSEYSYSDVEEATKTK